ncbi:MAG: DUF1282 family protein [Zoogloeaceae bacterium]|nr:DUF1282 family protein [Zoogloeaceae bacterium]
MSFATFPKMLVSETEGWSDVARVHPSVSKLFMTLVVPLSLVPPVLYAFAELAHPGAIFPSMEPALMAREAFWVGGLFFLAELAAVAFMANVIQQIARSHQCDTDYASAYALAAIAPVPLWMASLALAIPSLWANVAVVAVAWWGTALLIRHGVRPLLAVHDPELAHRLANRITFVGVMAWVGMMVVMALLLSVVLGWR